jgi:glycosyltransferase involved in cell wall biosynthesis
VLIEAMASGTPPIGSTTGGIPDVITNGVNGLLFNRGDWEDLARKMYMLLSDQVLRNKLAKNAREIAVERYSWQAVASMMQKIYI